MIAYGGAAFVALTFIVLIKILRLLEKTPRVMAISTRALHDLRDPALDDDAKEIRMREHARALGLLFTSITAGTIFAIAAPLAVIWLLDAVGFMSMNQVLVALSSWPVLVGGTVAIAAQLWRGKASAHES